MLWGREPATNSPCGEGKALHQKQRALVPGCFRTQLNKATESRSGALAGFIAFKHTPPQAQPSLLHSSEQLQPQLRGAAPHNGQLLILSCCQAKPRASLPTPVLLGSGLTQG